jgi:hypothetical protein
MAEAGQILSERVRANLLALGIPPAKHAPDAIHGLFPREFNISATGMNPEEVAKVLVYLIERKVISVDEAVGLTSVHKVRPGWHFCQFYRDFDQLLEMVAPYIAEGLANGEACFWVMPEEVFPQAARDALAKLVPDVDDRIASGQLEMMSHPQWYLDGKGGLRSFEEISAGLLERQDRALARGFKFLRAAGDTGWVSGTEESKSFIDYEMKINAAIGATKVAAVCTYRADVTADEFVAIVTAHQDALQRPNA